MTDERHPLLAALGQRARALRSRKGLTRKALAAAAKVSERHLANLEQGTGNASLLVLNDIANALQCPLAELLGDETTQSAEWLLLRQLLAKQNDANLRRVRQAAAALLGEGNDSKQLQQRKRRIALVGLRGAGKSTLGRKLADALGVPFIELNQHIEQLAGCSVTEIQALYGMSAYRRYEHRALVQAVEQNTACVIATPGGLVSDLASFDHLLKHCTVAWLQASPQDHMARVMAQGDMRPMAASREAMDDLQRILEGRKAFYAQADFAIDTSAQSESGSLAMLLAQVKALA
jgi:XRE family transcriptional regulator, aerobic/anaerobic benzoate catabolism transcriptional regulator